MSSPLRISTDEAAPDRGALLAQWRFGGTAAAASALPGRIELPLPVLAGDSAAFWFGSAPVRASANGDIRAVEDGERLFATLSLPPPVDGDWRRLTREAYARVTRFQARCAYPALLKIWNYLPDITEGVGDLERYRQFTLGRIEGWGRWPRAEHALPAATAIGTPAGGLQLIWLAARRPGVQIENPRQISAFRYPRNYGPAAPSFSRATLERGPGAVHLYVSGTASIVGHRSLHPGDTAAQLDEILRNLAALTAAARRRAGLREPLAARSLVAYLRQPRAAAAVADVLRREFGPGVPLSVLGAQICRRELLVEVEGVFAAPA